MTSAPTTKSNALGYLASFGVVLVFVLGVWAGRFTAGYPIKRALAYWDLAANLGTMADNNDDHAVRTAAYLDPAAAQRDMYRYTWVMPNTPAPFLGTLTQEADINGVHVTGRGFRAPSDPVMPKPEGRIRIFVTGGSTAFSVGAPNEESTIAGFLQAALNESRSATSTIAYEVITFANPSWATTHERIAVQNVLQHFDPDLVISFSGTNDAVWSHLGRDTHFFRTHYGETWFQVADAASRLAGRGPLRDPVRVADAPVPVAQAVARLVDNVRVARFVLAQRGVPYLYALQPTLYAASHPTAREVGLRAKQDPSKVTYFAEMYPEISRQLEALEGDGLTFVDLSDVFADAGGEEMFLDAYHFGDRGNRHIARALARAVLQLKLRHRPASRG
ncbi:MAG: SGNH/GDSL hydrolase family protein [Myxococcales bacterium]|nr:SGNH/GDSL hydrolase family protein [Myxococcales bacterium]